MTSDVIVDTLLICFFWLGLIFIFYNIIRLKIDERKTRKLTKELSKKSDELHDKFLKIYYEKDNEEVVKTRWAQSLYDKFKNVYGDAYLFYGVWPDKDYEWYEKQEKELRSLFNEFYLNLNKIKDEVLNNKKTWYNTLLNLDNFFVAIPIGSNEEFYCFTTKININEYNNLETIVFTEREKSGKKNIITPYTHKLRNMTKSEFDNKFIMDRMNVMNFNNEKKALEYYEYMINKFNNKLV
jgi:hypothetical protein